MITPLVVPLLLAHSPPAPSLSLAGLTRPTQDTDQVAPPDFANEVRPILARRCFACHGNDEETREAGLRLDSFFEATKDRDGFPAVAPGEPDDSELMVRVMDDIDPMPPEGTGVALTADEVDILRRWIAGGAEYAPHWAFVPPLKPAIEQVQGVHPLDTLVAEEHLLRGLEWSPEADDYTLYRRLSFDLTGLPPSPEAARAFADSTEPGKYEAAVEDLLASPGYAERWAAVWLDLARYADSSGHGSDPLRVIWRYRDWVIEAFDQNMPFDEFTVQQLAGDLLPDADDQTRLATAFHRNTMTNTEGGTDDEEFRVLAVKDRVNTTMSVWMGLTAGCAECHSHKYDPISHVEYYELFDIFNQTVDTDQADDRPRMDTPTPAQRDAHSRLSAELADLEERTRTLFVDPASPRYRALQGELVERAEAVLWSPAELQDVAETLGASTIRDDGGVLNSPGEEPRGQTVRWVSGAQGTPTALRLDVLSDESLPNKGPGLAVPYGNFVLNHLSVRATAVDAAPVTVSGVRVELPGVDRILSLAEVQLLDAEGAVIAGAWSSVTQSSTGYGGAARRAVDGNTDGAYDQNSVTHTDTSVAPWWQAELAEPRTIGGVRLWPRTDTDLESRSHGLRVVLLGPEGDVVWSSVLAPAPAGDGDGTLVAEGGDSPVPFLDVGPVVGQPLLLQSSGASYEQRGFSAAMAVDGKWSSKTGWAVGGAEGRDHAALWTLPELPPAAYRWTADLGQAYAGHRLGCWRLSTTVGPGKPLFLPEATLAALRKPSSEQSPREARDVSVAPEAHDLEFRRLKGASEDVAARLAALDVVSTPVMVQRPAKDRRSSYVLTRGNFLQREEQVHAAVPKVFPPLPDGVEPDRLALARWLVSDDNPLTARVTVNRVWARLFGRGIVASEGDFGSQSELPTHQRLLDWLAVEFRQSGWDHRALLRTIVTSRTYRQSSNVTGTDVTADPEGTWLSRFPRQRLEAEMVRDMGLSVSGLLSKKRFGPSVFPPQPDGLWKAAFNGQRDWTESLGEDRYRRGLYVFMRRTIPYPMLATFDAPSRESCTVQRIPTNTPLQAFVTMNDPVFVEASQALARRALAMDPMDPQRAAGPRRTIHNMLWCVTSRPPSTEQVEILHSLFVDAREAFAAEPVAATAFGISTVGTELTSNTEAAAVADLAAWTLVASTALNLDRALTKE